MEPQARGLADGRMTATTPEGRRGRTTVAILLALAACTSTPKRELLIASASSLAPAFDEIAQALGSQGGSLVVFSYGASVDLAEQMRNGAPFDVFASAEPALIDELAAEGVVDPSTTRVFAAGELGLLAVSDSDGPAGDDLSLLTSPSIRAIAIPNPEHAPSGRSARQALEAAGLWQALSERIVFGSSAQHALELFETGNAQAAIVPISLLVETSLPWHKLPADLYDAPTYSAAARVGSAKMESVQQFLRFLVSEEGRVILLAHGLSPASPP